MHSSVDSLTQAMQELAAETDTHACFFFCHKEKPVGVVLQGSQSAKQRAATGSISSAHKHPVEEEDVSRVTAEQRSAPRLTGVHRRMEVKVPSTSGDAESRGSTVGITIAGHQAFESEINAD